MRSIWTGHIVFGSIFIPVRLYAASGNLHVNFHQVHKEDCGRVRYKKVCEKDGKELTRDEIGKAYIIAGECIQFTDEEIEALKPAATRTMEIEGFCDFDEIPVVSLSKSYYLGTESPTRGGVGQSFHLLRKAVEKRDKVAVVKWVARSNEYLGILQPHHEGFLLKQLLYNEQVRSTDEMEVIETEVNPDLVDKGAQVVDNMTFQFNWEEYIETYTQQVKELIEKKALGEPIEIPEFKPPEVRSLEAELEKMLATAED
jgi:DNA end-binding protein Ku